MQCQRSQFVKHGKYVSCVAHAAKVAVTLGLITTHLIFLYVKAAAKSK